MNDTHTTVGMPFKGRRLLIVGVFTLVAIGVVSVTAATDAVACSCAMGTDAQSYDNADAVFTGRLVGPVQQVPVIDPVFGEPPGR